MQIDPFTQELQQRVEAIIGGASDAGLRSQLVNEALQAALNATATHNFEHGKQAEAKRRRDEFYGGD